MRVHKTNNDTLEGAYLPNRIAFACSTVSNDRIMPTQQLDREIRDRIDAFLLELSTLVKRAALESVHEALGGQGTPSRGPGRPRKVTMRAAGRRRRMSAGGVRGKRTSEQVDQAGARVLSQVKAYPGQRLEEIGVALKTPTKALKLPVAKLMADKKLKTKGQKRGTKYFPR
jgi:hypothetical protein